MDRTELTVSCKDCNYIPKVKDAGLSCTDNKLGIQYQIMHNGVKVLLGGYHGEWMTEIIRKLKGHHEPQEEKVFYEVLKLIPEKSVMIELGAYWSYYSLWFQKEIESAKNYMVEPNPEKLELGKLNFKLNCFDGDFTQGFIVNNSSDSATFTDWDGKEYAIPKISIDCFVQQKNINHVNILHADIQGAEVEMLFGCKECFAQGLIDYIFISTHGDKHKLCKELLINHDFKIIAEHTVDESFSADGLIVACASHVNSLGQVKISKRLWFQRMTIIDYKPYMIKLIKYPFRVVLNAYCRLANIIKKVGRQANDAIVAHNYFSAMSKIVNIDNVCFRNGKSYLTLDDGRSYRYNPGIKVAKLYSIPSNGNFEEKETAFVKKLIKQGQVCFDIGGCFGWYTILLSKLVGESGAVHVFEPIESNYKMLIENIQYNNCNNVYANNLALDISSGQRDVYVPDIGVSGSFALHRYGKTYSTFICTTIKLDDYCEYNKITNIDFIKADIEGAELLMLKGGINIISRSMPVLLLEIQDRSTKLFGYKPLNIFVLLLNLGYRAYYVNSEVELVEVSDYGGKLHDYNFVFIPNLKTF